MRTSAVLRFRLLTFTNEASTLCLQADRPLALGVYASVTAAETHRGSDTAGSPFLLASFLLVGSEREGDEMAASDFNSEILRKQLMVNQMVNAVGCTPEQATTILQRAQWHSDVSLSLSPRHHTFRSTAGGTLRHAFVRIITLPFSLRRRRSLSSSTRTRCCPMFQLPLPFTQALAGARLGPLPAAPTLWG